MDNEKARLSPGQSALGAESNVSTLCSDCGWARGEPLPFCIKCCSLPLPGDGATLNPAPFDPFTHRKRPAQQPKQTPAVRDPARYAVAALKDELHTLANAPDGTRNVRLNDAAFAVARFVADGLLDYDATVTA